MFYETHIFAIIISIKYQFANHLDFSLCLGDPGSALEDEYALSFFCD
jgi:hypothetical protein